ncbi:protein lifeguard 1 isoform X1 [Lingula anatina]|uniref:Protein lifeguard 1 isoform X1 n=1 Tax=Lingula anatina TaxID=7574 RepID=A0A1S3IBY4_LINAN|nr:protein lifeguard 1 isoform X1 [Lingula anatina]|eukprot:XP_013395371.1 protein lifeguard 1 isoform X1 [Lingula anatina]
MGKFGEQSIRMGKFGEQSIFIGKFGEQSICMGKFGEQSICMSKFGEQSIRMGKFGEQSIRVGKFGEQSIRVGKFGEQSIRMGFIRKVYGILMCQLAVTMIFIALFLYVEPIAHYAQANPWMFYLAIAITFVTLIALACCTEVRRTFPMNMIFLGLFTLCESYFLGTVASTYKAEHVLMAVGITAAVALALTIFAFQTKIDFTMCSGLLFVLLIVLILFGLMCAIFRNHYAYIAYASLGALIFSFFMVFDTQLMLMAKHRYTVSPEEYIFVALNLYIDIVTLFLIILAIIRGTYGRH